MLGIKLSNVSGRCGNGGNGGNITVETKGAGNLIDWEEASGGDAGSGIPACIAGKEGKKGEINKI